MNTSLTTTISTPNIDYDSKSDYVHDFFNIINLLNSGATFNTLAELLVEKLKKLSQEENIFISLLDEEHKELKCVAGSGFYEARIGIFQSIYQGITSEIWKKVEHAHNAKNAETIYIDNYQNYDHKISTKEAQTINSLLVLPIISKNTVIGVVGIATTHIKVFDSTTLDILEKIVQLASTVIAHTQVQNQLREKNSQFEILHNVSLNVINRLDQEELFRTLLIKLIQLLNFGQAFICIVEKEHNHLRYVANTLGYKAKEETPVKKGEGLAGTVWQTGEAIYIDDYQKFSNKRSKTPFEVASIACVPLKVNQEVLGVLGLASENSFNFDSEFKARLQSFTDLASITLRNSQVFESLEFKTKELEYQAYHDKLTTLPNRAFFENQLDQSLNQATKLDTGIAVMFLDLDGFKHVNDTLGHDVGDTLLHIVAKRLMSRTRKKNTVARLGGDEFGIIIPKLQKKEEASKVANNILQCFEEPFSINEHSLQIGTSIGISLFPDDGQDAQTLLKHADSAMYAAKNNGKNTIRKFIPEFAIAAQKRLEIELDLNKAIQNNELELYYQPKISLASEQWLGAEALIRWNHPEKGFISPGDFIPIAEESNLIIDIDNWVLKEACQQTVAWQSQNHQHIAVAINISALHFEQPDFIQTIKDILDSYQLSAEFLEFEVTETVVMKDIDLVVQRLTQLKEMGITIAIDDFGTGYSSLQYLNKLPLDILKIDKSFIDDIDEQTQNPLVTGILTLAQSLNLKTIAEGVETIEQVEFLKLFGCSQAQGFYFAKPMPAQAFWEQYAKANS